MLLPNDGRSAVADAATVGLDWADDALRLVTKNPGEPHAGAGPEAGVPLQERP